MVANHRGGGESSMVVTTLLIGRTLASSVMYIGYSHLCVCLSLATFPQYCTDPDVSWGDGRGYPLVVHYWADLALVLWFCCYDSVTLCLSVTSITVDMSTYMLVCLSARVYMHVCLGTRAYSHT